MEVNGSLSIKALAKAREKKDDEWYTRYEDIEREITEEYWPFFKGKRVLCPCDDYSKSNFTRFFHENFHKLGLKLVTSIGIEGYRCYFDGQAQTVERVNGDFRGKDTLAEIKRADLIVTNPPFSLIPTFSSILLSSGKQFMLILPSFAQKYASLFRAFQKKQIWTGKGKGDNPSSELHMKFVRPNGGTEDINNVCWVTNIPYEGYIRELPLIDCKELPQCADGTNIPQFDRILELPKDYMDLMIVPCSIFRYNPLRQFKYHKVLNDVFVNGKGKFGRILISRLEAENV